MRDGVHLSTDVYRPTSDGKYPTLIVRTPYNKSPHSSWGFLIIDVEDAIQRGYVLVAQDTRGCHLSEGVFEPFTQEREDGHDAIEWIASQPWSNGIVGIFGASYMGVTSLQASVDAPAALRASLAYITAGDYYRTWGYVGGAFELGFNVRWVLDQALAQLSRPNHGIDSKVAGAVQDEMDLYRKDPIEFFKTNLDPLKIAPASASLIPHLKDWLAHPAYDEYWSRIDVIASADQVNVPVLSIAGWNDGMLGSMLPLFDALRERSPRDVRDKHRLIVGPWDHAAYLSSMTASTAGRRNFGPLAMGGRWGMSEAGLAWFDSCLKGIEPETPMRPIRYFQIGADIWRELDEWPRNRQKALWYLWSGGRANTRLGDGILCEQPPGNLPPDSYIYDPEEPAQTVGGRNLLHPYIPGGLQDQGALEDREDVLVYTSARLVNAVELCGPMRLELYIRTSAPTTDFTATLVDVDEEGIGMSVADGILRLANGEESINSTRKIEVDLWDTAYEFAVGHRIRVHVTSSNFPRFDRNKNVDPAAEVTSCAKAVQQIFHDEKHPSVLMLTLS